MGNRNNYSIVVLFITVLACTTSVTAGDVRVDVQVTQSPESVAAEQINSTITVDPPHVPAGGTSAVLVTLRSEEGVVLAARTVYIRLLSGTPPVESAKKITDENGLVVFTVTSPIPQTARVEVYDDSSTPLVKLIQEPTIIFDGGENSPADITLAATHFNVRPPWYTQVMTFLNNLFRLRL